MERIFTKIRNFLWSLKYDLSKCKTDVYYSNEFSSSIEAYSSGYLKLRVCLLLFGVSIQIPWFKRKNAKWSVAMTSRALHFAHGDGHKVLQLPWGRTRGAAYYLQGMVNQPISKFWERDPRKTYEWKDVEETDAPRVFDTTVSITDRDGNSQQVMVYYIVLMELAPHLDRFIGKEQTVEYYCVQFVEWSPVFMDALLRAPRHQISPGEPPPHCVEFYMGVENSL